MKKKSIVLLLTFFLGGCATMENGFKYQWSDYPEKTEAVNKGQITENEYLNDMLENIQVSTPSLSSLYIPVSFSDFDGAAIPPGYYADIGTTYLKLGEPEQAIKFYKLEARTWPESKNFMKNICEIIDKNKELYRGNKK